MRVLPPASKLKGGLSWLVNAQNFRGREVDCEICFALELFFILELNLIKLCDN